MLARCCRCGSAAAVAMAFNYAERHVWLDDLDDKGMLVAGYAMCDYHAERLTPPGGWRLSDLRRPVRPLFAAADVA